MTRNIPARIEFDIARGKLFSYIENLSSFVNQTSENYVYWIEREADALLGDLFARGQPVDISDLFNREIIACYDSSIFVSATLSIGGDFSYIAGRLGIENFKAISLQSSFDYQSQVVLYIDPDIGIRGRRRTISRRQATRLKSSITCRGIASCSLRRIRRCARSGAYSEG